MGCSRLEELARMMVELALDKGADYADVRYERAEGTSLEFRDRSLKEAVTSTDDGVGMRALVKGAWGFVSTNDITKGGLRKAALEAVRTARLCSSTIKVPEGLAPVKVERAKVLQRPRLDPLDMDLEQKLAMVKEVDGSARSFKQVVAVTISYYDAMTENGFFSTEGADIVQTAPVVSLQANIVAKGRGRTASMRTRTAGTQGLEIFKRKAPVDLATDGAKRAVVLLDGRKPPSGRLPLVSDPELTGVFAHEALGHACEADAIIGGDSLLEGRLGERVGAEIVSIYDDPTKKGRFGSFKYDDEGVRARKKALVKDGILRTFIQTRTTAHRLGMVPNGGARAESYSVRPLVRMSNTYIDGGDHGPEELFEGIRLGVYAKGSRGGQVDTAKGSFQFNAQEAFLIEKGEVTVPLRDLSLSGMTLEILSHVEALGKDLVVEDPGYCGKGQWVPVGDGGPHMRVKKAIVGGG